MIGSSSTIRIFLELPCMMYVRLPSTTKKGTTEVVPRFEGKRLRLCLQSAGLDPAYQGTPSFFERVCFPAAIGRQEL